MFSFSRLVVIRLSGWTRFCRIAGSKVLMISYQVLLDEVSDRC